MKRYTPPSIHSSTVHLSQDGEAARCPSAEQRAKKTVHAYTTELSHKKNEIMPFAATQMAPEVTILSQVKSNREKQILHAIIYI